MARISLIVIPGYPHHVTQRGVRSKAVFQLVKDWREFLQDGASKEKELQMATQTGRPAGNKEFVAFLEKLTGRDLSRGKPGWPIKG